ncbi:MAG TPA: N-acetylmuramoyl-L-alanine amidase [Limnobacter sp.]|uniref:peptidoglycan recognition protein family protein n=1 Tax=Limnobacter sp. TaxID=2003368 RepID=UPI002E358761|nr:N-acetylmuramoyl-L-alanine amidase [Limnobacter sp.]HEX5484639.1 N-acetylmuramoyl-L-alanine amidase [Limnobacter sp.]
MLNVNPQGGVINRRIRLHLLPSLDHGPMPTVHGIVVHQTDSDTAASTLKAYEHQASGAHFLIDKDGSIFQTISVYRKAQHVGWLKSRCLATHVCSPTELHNLRGKSPGKAIGRVEAAKPWPRRYPSNSDSFGIELVGKALPNSMGQLTYEALTELQQASLKWLVSELQITFKLPTVEVFRHPVVSWKNATEAESARW